MSSEEEAPTTRRDYTMTQLDLNFEKTKGSGDNSQKSNNEIEVLQGKGTREDIKARQRAQESSRNNLPGVDVS